MAHTTAALLLLLARGALGDYVSLDCCYTDSTCASKTAEPGGFAQLAITSSCGNSATPWYSPGECISGNSSTGGPGYSRVTNCTSSEWIPTPTSGIWWSYYSTGICAGPGNLVMTRLNNPATCTAVPSDGPPGVVGAKAVCTTDGGAQLWGFAAGDCTGEPNFVFDIGASFNISTRRAFGTCGALAGPASSASQIVSCYGAQVAPLPPTQSGGGSIPDACPAASSTTQAAVAALSGQPAYGASYGPTPSYNPSASYGASPTYMPSSTFMPSPSYTQPPDGARQTVSGTPFSSFGPAPSSPPGGGGGGGSGASYAPSPADMHSYSPSASYAPSPADAHSYSPGASFATSPSDAPIPSYAASPSAAPSSAFAPSGEPNPSYDTSPSYAASPSAAPSSTLAPSGEPNPSYEPSTAPGRRQLRVHFGDFLGGRQLQPTASYAPSYSYGPTPTPTPTLPTLGSCYSGSSRSGTSLVSVPNFVPPGARLVACGAVTVTCGRNSPACQVSQGTYLEENSKLRWYFAAAECVRNRWPQQYPPPRPPLFLSPPPFPFPYVPQPVLARSIFRHSRLRAQ
jgi:hypothetical protein